MADPVNEQTIELQEASENVEDQPEVKAQETSIVAQSKLAKFIAAAITVAQGELENLRKKIAEYDQLNQATEKATIFLNEAVEVAKTRIQEVRVALETIPVSGFPSAAVAEALIRANAAIQSIKDQAQIYDTQFGVTTTVSSSIKTVTNAASNAIDNARTRVQTASGQAQSDVSSMMATTGAALIQRAAELDAAYNITGRAMAAAMGVDERFNVSGTAKALDDKYGVTATAAVAANAAIERAGQLDASLTGGKVTAAVVQGVELATAGAAYVQDSYGTAKEQLQAASAPAEGQAEAVADAQVEAAEVAAEAEAGAGGEGAPAAE